MLALLVVLPAFAGTPAKAPAYYHPDDVAAKSAKFSSASDVVAPKFDAAEKLVDQYRAAGSALEVGTALLGTSAPAALVTFESDTRRQLSGQYLRLDKHVSLIQDDFSNVFTQAVARVLPALSAGKDVKVCEAKAGPMGLGPKTSDCVGEDLNAAVATAIDKDAQLDKDLKDILSVDWPTIALASAPQAVVAVTGTDRWVSLSDVAKKLAGDRLNDRETTFEAEAEKLSDGLSTKDPASIAAYAAAKKAYVAGLGVDGAVLRAAVEASLKKQKAAPAAWGWCANPKALGGCAGEDVTAATLHLLAADKKLAKLSFPAE